MSRGTPLKCRTFARPWLANFSERAKKSARLCGEMRVQFCLPKHLLSPALSRRPSGASLALSPARPQRSPDAPPTPLKCRTCAQLYSRPSNSLNNLRCRASRLSGAAPPRRPWQGNFSERAKKSAHLCGEMRVHFCLPKLCCLTKRKGRAHKNPPNRFLEARGPALNAQLPADGRDARERRRPLVAPAWRRIFPQNQIYGFGRRSWPAPARRVQGCSGLALPICRPGAPLVCSTGGLAVLLPNRNRNKE